MYKNVFMFSTRLLKVSNIIRNKFGEDVTARWSISFEFKLLNFVGQKNERMSS